MNADLLENATNYHGRLLFNLILKQNNCLNSESANDANTMDKSNMQRPEADKQFK